MQIYHTINTAIKLNIISLLYQLLLNEAWNIPLDQKGTDNYATEIHLLLPQSNPFTVITIFSQILLLVGNWSETKLVIFSIMNNKSDRNNQCVCIFNMIIDSKFYFILQGSFHVNVLKSG